MVGPGYIISCTYLVSKKGDVVMKRKTTKEILAESLREIAENKSVDKITIQEIVDNCEYSPATFYRHFKDKYDLIAWDYVHQTDEIIDRVGEDEYQWKNILIDFTEYFLKNKEYIQNLLRHTSGHDAFIRHFSEANTRQLIKCIIKLSGEKKLDSDMEIYASIYCYGTGQIVSKWLLDHIVCDGDHLAELLDKALPIPLRGILCGE